MSADKLVPLTAEEIAHLRQSVHVLPPVWAGAVLRLCDAAEALTERDARIAVLIEIADSLRSQLDPSPAKAEMAIDRMRRENLALRARLPVSAVAEALTARDAEIAARKEDAVEAGAQIERLGWLLAKLRAELERADTRRFLGDPIKGIGLASQPDSEGGDHD